MFVKFLCRLWSSTSVYLFPTIGGERRVCERCLFAAAARGVFCIGKKPLIRCHIILRFGGALISYETIQIFVLKMHISDKEM
ncbi:hypothetical protein L1987_80819 [Smallanthus sonchifolius]|uniref:Uncharacterized protein n=1 Tax=Smallanthus sonchifolius TaxID=185202 RepID=A0ACB8YPA8_9ASTR|nr:hypothetical protein L1987_80819 [Smallanthus sonchifolius]